MLEFTKIREEATRRRQALRIKQSPQRTQTQKHVTPVWSLRKHFGAGGGAVQGIAYGSLLPLPGIEPVPLHWQTGSKPPRKSFSVRQ